jgi:predicted nucleic acid-binding protein
MRLVLDSSAALRASMSKAAYADLAEHELVAPPLLWSEIYSAVHEALWRRDLDEDRANALLSAFRSLDLRRRAPAGLYRAAYEIASELGWAKTYDAEFLALARIERARVLTTDSRLRRGADRTGLVMDPTDLPSRQQSRM